MNKKQMLKEQKRLKEEQKQVSNLFQDDKEVYNVFKILLGVIIFIGLSFVIINVFNGNWNLFTKNNTPVEAIDSKMVMAGTMFNKKENEEYMVLAYDMSDDEYDFYSALSDDYYGRKELYLLDLSSGFNSAFLAEKANISNDLSKLKFAGPTLLVIKDDKIVSSYTDEKAITDYIMDEK